jgi:hypothetical protein
MHKHFNKILYLVALGFFVYLIAFHAILTAFPYQQELREPGMLMATKLTAQGINTFSFDNQPHNLNLYGFVYAEIAAPFANILPVRSIVYHKVLAAFFLIISLFLLLRVQSRLSIPLPLVFLNTALIYATFLHGANPLPRPDTFGELLYLLLFCIPVLFNYGNRYLLICMLLGIVALYTKFYFAFGIPILLSYVFLFVSKKKAVLQAVYFGVALALSLVLVYYRYPAWYYHSLSTTLHATYYSVFTMLYQLRDYFFKQNVGYTILIFALLVVGIKNLFSFNWRRVATGFVQDVDLRHLDTPLLTKPYISLFSYVTLTTAFLFVSKMGGHGGAYMLYFFQLTAPFLIIEVTRIAWQLLPQKLIYGSVIASLFSSALFLGRLPNKQDQSKFELAESLIQKHKNVFAHPSVGSILLDHSYDLWDNGYQEYYIYSGWRGHIAAQKIFTHAAEVQRNYTDYISGIKGMVARQKFDLVIVPRNRPYWLSLDSLLVAKYVLNDSVDLPMAHTDEVWQLGMWIPRTDTANNFDASAQP